MFFNVNTAALVATGFALTANAHLFLSSPMPIPGNAVKDPLDASGSNFPCHGSSIPQSGGERMEAGSSQLLHFDTGNGLNTAVHGGGSCQISITYDTDPAKMKDPKNWKVIYSIEQGCPTNTLLNLDQSYQGPEGSYTGSWPCGDPKANSVDCVNAFNFTIPKGVKNGHAILAWTWYNNVGNRELYMNCVNTQIAGGDGSEDAEFPSMFVANMAGINQCPTTMYTAIQFPFAGKYKTTKTADGAAAKTASAYPLAIPSGPDCANNGAPVGKGSSPPSSAAPEPSSGAPAPSYGGSSAAAGSSGIATVTTISTVSASAAPSGSAAPSYPAGSQSAAPSGIPSAAPSAAPSAPSSAAPSGSAPSYPPSASGSPSTGSCSNGRVHCPTPGSVYCVSSSHFALCDIDNCGVPQALAAGTHCTGGAVTKRSSHVRRHARGEYAHRRY